MPDIQSGMDVPTQWQFGFVDKFNDNGFTLLLVNAALLWPKSYSRLLSSILNHNYLLQLFVYFRENFYCIFMFNKIRPPLPLPLLCYRLVLITGHLIEGKHKLNSIKTFYPK